MDPAGGRLHSEQFEELAMGQGQRLLFAGALVAPCIIHALLEGGVPQPAGELRAQDHEVVHHLQVPAFRCLDTCKIVKSQGQPVPSSSPTPLHLKNFASAPE